MIYAANRQTGFMPTFNANVLSKDLKDGKQLESMNLSYIHTKCFHSTLNNRWYLCLF